MINDPVGTDQMQRDGTRRRAAALSFGVGLVVLAIKAVAYFGTGSSAIFSDLLESVVHVFATGLVWYAMRVALAPPDADHPYGHGKAEYLSVGFEGALIFMAAAGIIWHTVERFFAPMAVDDLGFGLWLIGAVALINLALGLYLHVVGKKTNSPLLIGDAQHVLSDVWTTGGVFVGLGLVALTGWLWMDQSIALAVALFLAWTGARMIRDSFHGLMDSADADSVRRVVAVLNRLREPAWTDVHNLRLRRTGDRVYIDMHLTVPGEWSVHVAHAMMDRIESAIMQELGARGAVLIHLDCRKPHEVDSTADFSVERAIRMKKGNFEA